MSGAIGAFGTPKQLKILQAITALLQSITPANNYDVDLSGSVFRGRTVYGDDDVLPLISILENPRPGVALTANEFGSTRKTTWELLIQGWVEDDKSNPLDPVYILKAIVESTLAQVVATKESTGRPVYPAIFNLGGLISQMRIGPGVCRPPDKQVSAKAFFYLPVSVEYKENLFSPWV